MAMNSRSRPRGLNATRGTGNPRPEPAANPQRPRPVRPREPSTRVDPAESTATPGPILDLGVVLERFTESWERGDQPLVESFLAQVPAEDSAELIYHEYCLAEASDLRPDPDDYLRRFPEQAEALSRLFQLHSALSDHDLKRLAEPAALPGVGDHIGPYHLIRELGEGAFARVFLAEQTDLADRLVVLKVSTRANAEPRLLARAIHPHIVPVIRHATANDDGLHLICLPFLGGATLSSILAVRSPAGAVRRAPRTGLDFLADLDRVAVPGSPGGTAQRLARDLIGASSYPRALAWIVARLAEALDHAHRRGVSHGDLKPSNILVTSDGMPMLFDFNLAVDWSDPEADISADAGGTLAYMAPERLLALAGLGGIESPRGTDRHRADLYGLGLVLREALTGRPPELPRDSGRDRARLASALASLRIGLRRPPRGRWGRPIPPALGAILSRCLAPDPADRYARGAELAEDLDRWRTDRPLAYAETPRATGPLRWLRRRRTTAIAVVTTVAVTIGLGTAASHALQGALADQAVDALAFLDRSDAEVFRFHRMGDWRADEHGDAADNARVQLIRYDVLGPGDWTLRAEIQNLPDHERDEHQAWVVEQIWRYADAIVRDRPDSRQDGERAAALLDRTLGRFPLEPLRATRRVLTDRFGAATPAVVSASTPPEPPRWLRAYLAGVAVERDHAREALESYRVSLEDRPDFFWANYRAAATACRVNDFPAAARHLRRCVARRPDNPALHAQLGQVLFRLTEPGYRRLFAWDSDGTMTLDDALAECERALVLNPDLPEALATRASIRRSLGQHDWVDADLDRFALLTRTRGESRGLMLRFRNQFRTGPSYVLPTHPTEMHWLDRALAAAPEDNDIRATLATTLLGSGRPDETIVQCDRILDRDPRHLRARYLRALALRQAGRPDAIPAFARLIADPRYEELLREDVEAIRAVHYVATDHLKAGRIGEALDLARTGLSQITRLGLIRRSNPVVGESHYLLARVLASTPDARDRLPAITDQLGRAFAESSRYRDGWLPRDSRFAAVRDLLHIPSVE